MSPHLKRLLRSLGMGLAAGFVLVWVFDSLPSPWDVGAIGGLFAVALGWLTREWLEIRRMRREIQAAIDRLQESSGE